MINRMVDKDPEAETDALMYNIFSAPAIKLGEKILRAKDIFTRADLNEGKILAFLNSKTNQASSTKHKYIYRGGPPRVRESLSAHFNQRDTGHLGTGIYAYGSKEQALAYENMPVFKIDVTKIKLFNLVSAHKKMGSQYAKLPRYPFIKMFSEAMNDAAWKMIWAEKKWEIDWEISKAIERGQKYGFSENEIRAAIEKSVAEANTTDSKHASQPINHLLLARGYGGVDPGPPMRDYNAVGIVIFREALGITEGEEENIIGHDDAWIQIRGPVEGTLSSSSVVITDILTKKKINKRKNMIKQQNEATPQELLDLDEIARTPSLRKLRSYQRDALLPLYNQHVEYLMRAIATARKDKKYKSIVKTVIENLPKWHQEATCHEIALNEVSNLDLETHENDHGTEREFMHHKHTAGRDLTARIIWELLARALLVNPDLQGIEPYEDLGGNIYYKCPYCDETIGIEERAKNVVGYHRDGTENWEWVSYGFAWQDFNCPHFVVWDGEGIWQFIEGYQDATRDIKDNRRFFEELKGNKEFVYDSLETYNQYGTLVDVFYFAKDPDWVLKKIQEYIAQEEKNNAPKRKNAFKQWPMSGKWRYSNHATQQQFDILANIEEKLPSKKIPKGQTSLTELSRKYTLEYKRKIARKIQKHFAWADHRLQTIYTPKIWEIFQQAKPFEQWSSDVQKVILNQLQSEGENLVLLKDQDVYAIAMFTESEMAGTYWEERARDFVEKYTGGEKIHGNAEDMERMPYHYNKIIQIEKMIKERGYDPRQPLMIECYPPSEKREAGFFQMGGHHRLQAIRNLIKSGDLPKGFQFPVLCRFQKDRWGLESEHEHFEREWAIREQWFAAHPGKHDFPGDW